MRNNYKKRRAFEEPGYWQSFSDMMAALLLIFILIIAITLAIYRQKTIALEQTQGELENARTELETARTELETTKEDLLSSWEELETSNAELEASLAELQELYNQAALTQAELEEAYALINSAQEELAATRSELEDIVGIRTDIIAELQETFSDSSMTIDTQTGSITFSSDVLFDYNSSVLTDEASMTLQEIIPKYLEVLLQDGYRPYIAEIIIEGHTDTNGTYDWNMQLSFRRAYSVATFCMDTENGLSEEKIAQLQELLTVNGRSYSDPVYVDGTDEVDMAASRRVEIKFRLKEEEMITKIAEILNETADE